MNCELREGGMVWDRGPAPPRGDIRIEGLPEFPEVPDDASGRLQLAQWIASPTHPLTARVMANRVWQHLFGRGLVETVDNFGLTGRDPSHPELLDHLAVRFVENGWSVKQLIRTIMLSRTYQLNGEHQPAAAEKDPDNTLYWRSKPRRLELEPLRDSMLFVAGSLSAEPPAPGYLAGNGSRGRGKVRGEIGFNSSYRTLYLPVIRDLLSEEFGLFDFPDPSSVNGLRHVTTAPPQALFFMNSQFVENASYDVVDRLYDLAKSDDDRIDLAYQIILSREPDAEERSEAMDLMRRTRRGRFEGPRGLSLVGVRSVAARQRGIPLRFVILADDHDAFPTIPNASRERQRRNSYKPQGNALGIPRLDECSLKGCLKLPPLNQSFRTELHLPNRIPRALPWASMNEAVGLIDRQ